MKEFLIDWYGVGFIIGIAGFMIAIHFASMQRIGLMFLFVFIGVGGLFGLMIGHTTMTNERADACRSAGGHPIIGDRGHYKTCIDSEYVIRID